MISSNIGSTIGSIIGSTICSNELVWKLPHISVISWSFFTIFLLKISLISIFYLPPRLPCFMLKALSNLSGKIQIFGNRHRRRPHYICMTSLPYANEATQIWGRRQYGRNRPFSNILSLVAKRFYNRKLQFLYQSIAPYKTSFMPKKLSQIPSNKGVIQGEPPLGETKWTNKNLSQ